MMNISLKNTVLTALQEDIQGLDITAELIPADQTMQMNLLCREDCILCGVDWFNESFYCLNPHISIDWSSCDSDSIKKDSVICQIEGNARNLLTAERTALNFLQTLSGTATVTRQYADLIQHTHCKILDTRKTIPGLRIAQKYAVKCGGGVNHRMGLYDAYLLKENHIAASKNITSAVTLARQLDPGTFLEVEVETLEQLEECMTAKVDRVLLDNFDIEQLKSAVAINQHATELEASGNIDQGNIVAVAETGVDFISIGAITKHVRAIDFSLRYC